MGNPRWCTCWLEAQGSVFKSVLINQLETRSDVGWVDVAKWGSNWGGGGFECESTTCLNIRPMNVWWLQKTNFLDEFKSFNDHLTGVDVFVLSSFLKGEGNWSGGESMFNQTYSNARVAKSSPRFVAKKHANFLSVVGGFENWNSTQESYTASNQIETK